MGDKNSFPKGKLIVFEGTDCSGKSTQIKLLIEKLCSEGKKVVTLDFPNYSTPTGKIVRQYLDNEFGPANEIPAKVASIFYAEDRFVSKPIIEKALEENDFVILDRYVESNLGHQGGKIRDPEKRKEFFDWNVNLEYGNFSLPKPDAVVFLYMPPGVSQELMKTRERKSEFHPGAEKLDGHEGSKDHLKNAAESYLQLSNIYGWVKIECAPSGTFQTLRTPENIFDELLEKMDEAIKYSSQEKVVLNYFFTNLNNPIFVTTHFNPEVWALMQARYSRSQMGMRESFLKLLKEDPENFKALYEEIQKTEGSIAMNHATEKAIKFMEKWVLGYGHSSIAEGAVIGLGLEGVSILATKVIEDNRLSSFCEKSTRYVSFKRSSFYMDMDLKNSEFNTEISEMLDFLFETYSELHEPVLEYVKKNAPLSSETSSAAWERACGSRRFDAIRYLLPACTKTSLGWTVNARELTHAISKFLSHPLKEMNLLGEKIKSESLKTLPSLLKHADKKDYFVDTRNQMMSVAKEINFTNSLRENVELVSGPNDGDEKIISSILYQYKNESFTDILNGVRQMNIEDKQVVLDSYLNKMKDFDHPLRGLEHVSFTFDIVMDYGAFRDLQRHRICTQTNQMFSSDLGYDVPEDIVNSGVEAKYREAMELAKRVYEKVRIKFPVQAQYLLPLGFKKRFLVTMNLRELHHLIKIRTTPLAHPSYRKIAFKIYNLVKEKYPFLSQYIVCNFHQEDLGRLKAEEKTEEKRTLI